MVDARITHRMIIPPFVGLVLLISMDIGGISAYPYFKYYKHQERERFLYDIASRYPRITHLYSIGRSVEGREIWAIAIGEKPRENVLLRPDVRYVGNMHGNEIVNQVMLIHFINHLVTNYRRNSTITRFLQRTRVHILPSMNPDGAEQAGYHPSYGDLWNRGYPSHQHDRDMCIDSTHGRYNKNGIDLNRNFPDYWYGKSLTSRIPREPETTAVMRWMQEYQFVLSANIHGGALLVNYPLDSYKGARTSNYVSKESISPDDDIFKKLSNVYARTHPRMHLGKGCSYRNQTIFSHSGGVVNGANWYPIHGGMQDWSYLFAGCFEVTLELHCCKFASVAVLQERWRENKDALYNFISQVHIGVKGIVTSETGFEIKGATVRIVGRELFESQTTSFGEYWRLLLPGDYTLEVLKIGYHPSRKNITINRGELFVQNFTLKAESKEPQKPEDTLVPKTEPPQCTCPVTCPTTENPIVTEIESSTPTILQTPTTTTSKTPTSIPDNINITKKKLETSTEKSSDPDLDNTLRENEPQKGAVVNKFNPLIYNELAICISLVLGMRTIL